MLWTGEFMAKAGRKVSTRKSRKRRRPLARRPRAIEVALAGLAHDIRTPLTGILALSQLLQASDLPSRERGWAEAIRGAADHLARLTTIVVDAAKADATGLVLRHEPFSPRELADSVAGWLSARAQGKALDFDIDIAKGLPRRVSGDEVRLRSALENLIDNAVKFTERGKIAFAVSSAAAGRGRVRLTFTVTDSGMGITAADLKRLFRPFAQASEAVARRYGGAGLGLVMVKRIAKVMGGDLTVTSKPGRGSTFRLTVVMKSAAAMPGRRVSSGKAITGLRILSVEDNPYGRIVHSAVLRELGHSVSFVGSGEAAVETVARNEHDVVLMDIALSGIDGIETTRRIRALPAPAGRIPIIGVSGKSEPRDAAAARAAGMNDYLAKPATPAEINAALESVAKLSAGGSAERSAAE
jgi:CheY-like chemotaxis protein/nitrogen-specific signal transduction histidine kinase